MKGAEFTVRIVINDTYANMVPDPVLIAWLIPQWIRKNILRHIPAPDRNASEYLAVEADTNARPLFAWGDISFGKIATTEDVFK